MDEKKYWLIFYDIRDVRRLARAAKCIASYGWRIQRSVFESHADEKTIRIMEYRLGKILTEEDSVFILPVCEHDKKKRMVFGVSGRGDPMAENCIIV